MILNGTWFTQFPNPNKLRVIRALVFEAAGEALRSWNFAAYFCPLANEGMRWTCVRNFQSSCFRQKSRIFFTLIRVLH